MNFSLKIKLLVIAVLAAAFFAFNAGQQPERSEQQLRFDSWLSMREKSLSEAISANYSFPAANSRLSIPLLSLRLDADDSGAPQTYSVGLASNQEQAKRVLRLLQLMKEADVFSMPKNSDEQIPSATFSVEDGSTSFKLKVREQDLQRSMKAMLMLRLFREYGAQGLDSMPSKA